MSEKKPLISIVMTSYNGERFIAKQLESILAQTYEHIELIVCDDGSTDATISILKAYQQKYPFTLLLNVHRLGVVKNFEQGLGYCKGDYIALADQDDIWHVEKLQRLYEMIGSNLLIHSDARLIDEDDTVFSKSYTHFAHKRLRRNTYEYFFNNDVTGCTCMFQKELLNKVLPFPKDIIVHDWWLSICASKNGSITYLPEVLIDYRQHTHNQIGAANTSRVHPHSKRKSAYEKTLFFLQSLHQQNNWSAKEEEVLSNLIVYYSDYFTKSMRPRSFWIHLKYFNLFMNDKSVLYRFIGLVLSLFGETIQEKLWRVIKR